MLWIPSWCWGIIQNSEELWRLCWVILISIKTSMSLCLKLTSEVRLMSVIAFDTCWCSSHIKILDTCFIISLAHIAMHTSTGPLINSKLLNLISYVSVNRKIINSTLFWLRYVINRRPFMNLLYCFANAVVGGLLSAHLMSQRGGLELETGWPCRGPLLRLAEEVASRLLPGAWFNQQHCLFVYQLCKVVINATVMCVRGLGNIIILT